MWFFVSSSDSLLNSLYYKKKYLIIVRVIGVEFMGLFEVLPANLFSCSCILAFNNGGWANVERYIWVVYKLCKDNVLFFINYITNPPKKETSEE